jgi:hypothetical protein
MKRIIKRKIFCSIAMVIILATLSGCFAARTAIVKKDLQVKTKMSETIFLDPVAQEKKIIYLQVRNTTGIDALSVENQIKALIEKNGYRVTPDPVKASFILQANVLQAGKNESEASLLQNFGDAAVPAIIGGVIGRNTGGKTGAIIGATVGAAAGFVGSSLMEDTTYSITADLEIRQKTSSAVKISKAKGDDANEDEDEHEDKKTKKHKKINKENKSNNIDENGRKKYTTRLIVYANKANLKYNEAEPELIRYLVNSIAGMF